MLAATWNVGEFCGYARAGAGLLAFCCGGALPARRAGHSNGADDAGLPGRTPWQQLQACRLPEPSIAWLRCSTDQPRRMPLPVLWLAVRSRAGGTNSEPGRQGGGAVAVGALVQPHPRPSQVSPWQPQAGGAQAALRHAAAEAWRTSGGGGRSLYSSAAPQLLH